MRKIPNLLGSRREFLENSAACFGLCGLAFTSSVQTGCAGPIQLQNSTPIIKKSGILAIASSNDGKFLVTSDGTFIERWNNDGLLLNSIRRSGFGYPVFGDIAFWESDSEIIYLTPSGDNISALQILNFDNPQIQYPVPGLVNTNDRARNAAVHFFVDAKNLTLAYATVASRAFGNLTANVAICSGLKPRITGTLLVNDGVSALAIFGAGRLLAVGTPQGSVSIFEIETLSLVRQIQVYPSVEGRMTAVGALSGSPDGNNLFIGPGLSYSSGNRLGGTTQNNPAPQAKIMNVRGGNFSWMHTISGFVRKAEWDGIGRTVAFITDEGLNTLSISRKGIELKSAHLHNPTALSMMNSDKSVFVAADLGVYNFRLGEN